MSMSSSIGYKSGETTLSYIKQSDESLRFKTYLYKIINRNGKSEHKISRAKVEISRNTVGSESRNTGCEPLPRGRVR